MQAGGRAHDHSEEEENLIPLLLHCQGYKRQRAKLWRALRQAWTTQLEELFHSEELTDQDRMLTLIGEAMKHDHESTNTRRETDRAVKTFLREVNEHRIGTLGLTSMLLPMQAEPVEVTMRLAQQWDEERKKRGT